MDQEEVAVVVGVWMVEGAVAVAMVEIEVAVGVAVAVVEAEAEAEREVGVVVAHHLGDQNTDALCPVCICF